LVGKIITALFANNNYLFEFTILQIFTAPIFINLKHKKPIFVTKIPEKTPEYSGVFLAEPEENIGFLCFRFS